MTGWKNLGLENGLQSMVVCVVMDLAVDLLLDDLVFVWLDDLMYNGCRFVSHVATSGGSKLTRGDRSVSVRVHGVFEVHNAFEHRLLFFFPVVSAIRALIVFRDRETRERFHGQRIVAGKSCHRLATFAQSMLVRERALLARSNVISQAAVVDIVTTHRILAGGGFGWYCAYGAAWTVYID